MQIHKNWLLLKKSSCELQLLKNVSSLINREVTDVKTNSKYCDIGDTVLQPHLEWALHVEMTGRRRAWCDSTWNGMKQSKASVEELGNVKSRYKEEMHFLHKWYIYRICCHVCFITQRILGEIPVQPHTPSTQHSKTYQLSQTWEARMWLYITELVNN